MKLNRNDCFFLILFVPLFSIFSLQLLSSLEKNAGYVDEPGWISSSNYYTDLLLKGDFQHQQWECPQCENWGSMNTHLGQWIMGIFVKTNLPTEQSNYFQMYNFKIPMAENIRLGNIPPKPLLVTARKSSAIFGILSGLLIFLVGYLSANKWIGGIAALLLLSNPLFVSLSSQAMTDIFFNFFLLCGCLTSLFLINSCRNSQSLRLNSYCGGFAGLAASVKITGLLLTGAHFVLILIYLRKICKLSTKIIFRNISAFMGAALITIYLLNPYFWPNLNEFNGTALTQESKAIFQEDRYQDLNYEKFQTDYPQLANVARPLELPYLFVRWNKLITHQSYQFGWKPDQNRLVELHKKLILNLSTIPLEWFFFGLGSIYYARQAIKTWRTGELNKNTSLCGYFLVNYAFIVALMKVDFDRYYLPTIIASKLISAAGIFWLFILIKSFYLENRSRLTSHMIKS